MVGGAVERLEFSGMGAIKGMHRGSLRFLVRTVQIFPVPRQKASSHPDSSPAWGL